MATSELDTYVRSLAASVATFPSSATPQQFVGRKAITYRFRGAVPKAIFLSGGERHTRENLVARLGALLATTKGLAWELDQRARDGTLEEIMLAEHKGVQHSESMSGMGDGASSVGGDDEEEKMRQRIIALEVAAEKARQAVEEKEEKARQAAEKAGTETKGLKKGAKEKPEDAGGGNGKEFVSGVGWVSVVKPATPKPPPSRTPPPTDPPKKPTTFPSTPPPPSSSTSSPLSYPLQHAIITPLQSLLEACCYQYLSVHHPHILTQERWTSPQSAELHVYMQKMMPLFEGQHCVPFKKLIEIRHIAVHRIPVRSGTIFALLNASAVSARILGNPATAGKIQKLQSLVAKQLYATREVEDVASKVSVRLKYLEDVQRQIEGEMARLSDVMVQLKGGSELAEQRTLRKFKTKVEDLLFVDNDDNAGFTGSCGVEELGEIRKRLKEGFRWQGGEGEVTVDYETTIEDIIVEDDTIVVDEEGYAPTAHY